MAKPTRKQLSYLRALAEQTATTFTPPATKTQASQAISALKNRNRSTASERRQEHREITRQVHEDRSATAIGHEETTGYGSTARWRHRS